MSGKAVAVVNVNKRLLFSIDDHSRVVLEQIEGDPQSDYINASYIPVSLAIPCYYARQSLLTLLVFNLIWINLFEI